MGFLSSDFIGGQLIVDVCLTDLGRSLIARGDGSFNVTRFTISDDCIDYSLWDSSSPGAEDRIILTTPIFEGFINESFALKYPAISCDVPNLKYLPKIEVSPTTITKYYRDAIKNAFVITVTQKMITNDVATIPSSIWDPSWMVEVDDDLLYCELDVINITGYNVGQYILPTEASTLSNVNSSTLYLRTREVTSEQWSTYGTGTSPSRQISTLVKFTGINSGLSTTATVILTESA